jgi:hypothetical protein
MKLSKVLHFLAAIVVALPIAVFAWLLSRPLPDIDPPLMAVDQREHSGPTFKDVRFTQTDWKREILDRFDENDLKDQSDPAAQVYRLVFLPTFDQPVCIRLDSRSGQYAVTVTKLSGQGGFTFDELGRRRPSETKSISRDDWLGLERLIETSRFWELETIDVFDEPVNDGAYWVLEGKNGLYHRVERIRPSEHLKTAMLRLIDLGGVRHDYAGYFEE